MRAILGAVAVLVLAGTSTVMGQEKLDAKKIVGKWQPADSPKGAPDVTIEYTKDNKLIILVDFMGKAEKIDGTYKLDGDKLEMTMTFMGKEMKETVTLTKLTDDEMAGKGKDGKEEKFKKVKPKP